MHMLARRLAARWARGRASIPGKEATEREQHGGGRGVVVWELQNQRQCSLPQNPSRSQAAALTTHLLNVAVSL